MIAKRYSSFEEIDADLKILRLQQQVDIESLKLSYQQTKNGLYPMKILGGFGGVMQKIAISLVAKKLFKKFT